MLTKSTLLPAAHAIRNLLIDAATNRKLEVHLVKSDFEGIAIDVEWDDLAEFLADFKGYEVVELAPSDIRAIEEAEDGYVIETWPVEFEFDPEAEEGEEDNEIGYVALVDYDEAEDTRIVLEMRATSAVWHFEEDTLRRFRIRVRVTNPA